MESSHKTIWMVSGNKGGVGKSLLCKALASALEMRQLPYGVFDGDGRTGDVYSAFVRKVPARWGDFRQLRPDSHNCVNDAAYENILHQLLLGSPHLIVNTPDGADTVLMKWFDVTLRHTESNNYQFVLVYVMSDRPDGLEILPALSERFSFLYPVRNLYFGGTETFAVFNREYQSGFSIGFDLPVLRSQEVRMLFDGQTYPAEALFSKNKETGTFKVNSLSRSRILAWQQEVCEFVDDIIDNSELPNVMDRG